VSGGEREPYELVVPGPVQRTISEKLPEGGLHSAHLGTFRVQYEIDDENRTVTVRRVEHRGDIYGLP
jgi:mRNA-degrading endonuclease RelE of RelBE toxin-antitoxin system